MARSGPASTVFSTWSSQRGWLVIRTSRWLGDDADALASLLMVMVPAPSRVVVTVLGTVAAPDQDAPGPPSELRGQLAPLARRVPEALDRAPRVTVRRHRDIRNRPVPAATIRAAGRAGACGHVVDRADVAPGVEAADPAGLAAAGGRGVTAHTHLTRDMKPLGECPACDEYHRYVPDDVWYPAEPEPPPAAGQGAGLAIALVIGLCLLAGALAVWLTIWLSEILTTT